MNMRAIRSITVAVAALVLLAAAPARAIPAFARKYGTSCQTCHTVYPKLTPFGEAFRRNGFRFPGSDGDFVKQEKIALGQDAYKDVFPNSVWPGTIPDSIPIGVGFNGQAVLHPDKNASAAKQDNGSIFTMNDLVAEGHLWAGGSFSERVTFFGEVTFSSAGTVDVEHAQLHFNDLLGPKHLINVRIGRGFSTLTSFGPHGSYVADAIMPSLALTAMYGSTSSSWNLLDHYNGIEVTGVVGGRFDYSIGVNAGANTDIRPSENAYAHLGFKLGGMRLDGEGDQAGSDKPWAENALTVDVFGYRATSRYVGADTAPQDDRVWLVGGNLRAQWQSLELNAGFYQEWHDRALINDTGDGTIGAVAFAQYDELSYVVFPWLVPALRFEYLSVRPDGHDEVHDLRLMPGVAFLIRPNVKFVLVGQIELANGVSTNQTPGVPASTFSWAPVGGFAAPVPGMTVSEIESITGTVAFAF